MPRALVLIATIPLRRHSCERLLSELTRQSRRPDGVLLNLDGYQDGRSAPHCPFPVLCGRWSPECKGAGQRWLLAEDLLRDGEVRSHDIIINLDDDCFTRRAPDLVKALVAGVEECGTAAAFGRTPDSKRAPPGTHSRGHLIYAGGNGLSVRAGLLAGLGAFANEVRAKTGIDHLGVRGDDDALLSAFLWKQGIKIRHAPTGVINAVAGTRRTSQTKDKLDRGEDLGAQKRMIAAATGWPWPRFAAPDSHGTPTDVAQPAPVRPGPSLWRGKR